MFNDLAFQYANNSGSEFRGIAFGLSIVGFVLAASTSRNDSELRRAPYFVYLSMLYLAFAVTQTAWLGWWQAVVGGYLWMLMAFDLVSMLIVFYFLGIFALARSRDAFGHEYCSILAFVPLANFVLLFKKSRSEASAKRFPTISLMIGNAGFWLGLGILTFGISVSVISTLQSQRMAQQANTNPIVQAKVIEFMIRVRGLESALSQLVDEVSVPQELDEMTTLAMFEAHGKTLHYRYTVRSRDWKPTEDFKESLAFDSCADGIMRPIFLAGGSIEYTYQREDLSEIVTVRVVRAHCGL